MRTAAFSKRVAAVVAAMAVVATMAVGAAAGATPASTATVRPTADPPGVIRARVQLQAIATKPTLIKVKVPLTKKPPTGKKAFLITTSVGGTTVRVASGWQAACKSLGWDCQFLTYTSNSADSIGLFQQALQQNPNYIAYLGQPPSIIAPSLVAARAANVPVFQTYGLIPAKGAENWIFSQVNGAEVYINAGKYLADQAILAAPGFKPNVLMVYLSTFDIWGLIKDSTQAELAKNCPGCAFATLDFPVGDLAAGKIPAAVVAYLRAHPEVNSVVYSGSTLVGNMPALAANAGINVGPTGIKVISSGCLDSSLKAVATGTENSCIAVPMEYLGWQLADAMARYSVGDSLTPNWNATTPQYQQNSKNTTATTNLYAGPPNYTGQFKFLWHVS